MRGTEQADQFTADALSGYACQQVFLFKQSGGSRCFDRKAEAGCETDRTQYAQSIFVQTVLGDADAADDAVFQVFLSAEEIAYFQCGRASHGIDGEVAAGTVFPETPGKCDRIGMTVIGIIPICPVGRDLNRHLIGNNCHSAMLDSRRKNGIFRTEYRKHLFGECIGGQIIIMHRPAEQCITHCTADHIAFMSVLIQFFHQTKHFVRDSHVHTQIILYNGDRIRKRRRDI